MSSIAAPIYSGWEPYYDAIDPPHSTKYVARGAYVNFYVSLVRPDTQSLLDLACGTGWITTIMAKKMVGAARSIRVVGVDQSPTMIAIAAQRCPEWEWLVGDMRNPPVEATFDLVTVCFQTLQVLPEQADLVATFSAARSCLAPGGRFAFDIYNPNLAFLRIYPSGRVVRRFAADDGRALHVQEEGWFDEKAMMLRLIWNLYDSASGQKIGIRPLVMNVKQFLPEDIKQSLVAANLKIAEYYGSLDRTPFNMSSRQQIVVCTAAG